MIPLVLASASPARLATLQAAGIQPLVCPTTVDEAYVLTAALRSEPGLSLPAQVQLLARAKAEAAADRSPAEAFVLGCDSMLELDGSLLGKPVDTADAARRIRQQAGRRATLHTGHWLLGPLPPCPKLSPTRAAPNTTPAEPNVGRRGEGATSSTGVLFGQITDSEIEAYVATGEPLAVAGAFTIDGFGGPFIDGIEGDHHGVVGLSLPTLRRLLGRFKVSVVDLWPDSATARSLKRPGRQADIGGTT